MAHISPLGVLWHPRMGHKGITADFCSQGPSATPTLECPLLDPTYLWVPQRISRRAVNRGKSLRSIFTHTQHSWESYPGLNKKEAERGHRKRAAQRRTHRSQNPMVRFQASPWESCRDGSPTGPIGCQCVTYVLT